MSRTVLWPGNADVSSMSLGGAPTPDQDLVSRLGMRKGRSWRKRIFWIGGIVIVLGAAAFLMTRSGAPHSYTTGVVKQGTLAVTVSATGTLAPRDQVDVGSEVSGKIDS